MNKETILLTDGYKLDHRRQYPEGTEYVYSNWTPRSNNYFPEATEGVVVFGIQYFIKEYLLKRFTSEFFKQPKDIAVKTFKRRVDTFLGENNVGTQHIEELHDLGYLPIKIKALPEGTLCPIRVPALTFINTHPKFFWLTNYFETLISTTLWLPMTSATSARLYKKELRRHAEATGFEPNDFSIHDFSMRGMAGLEAAIMSGMAHLTSFTGSETIPALSALEEYYNCNAEKELIAGTIPATEHSVMCAGGDSTELETFRRLITEVYPNGFVSIVSDTWDFWKVMSEYTVALKEEILARNGRTVFRPDSGDPVDIICGLDVLYLTTEDYEDMFYTVLEHDYFSIRGLYYKVDKEEVANEYNEYGKEVFEMTGTDINTLIDRGVFSLVELEPSVLKGAYRLLWDIFGGTINEKGYKVLNPKVGIIYGDSITLERQKEIYKRLEEKRFCASNLVLGVGSYTYQFRSRDSLSFAMKATWCQINGESIDIYKDPKTDNGVKKSLRGRIGVYYDDFMELTAHDQVNKATEESGELITVFEDGKLIKEYSLAEIRDRVNKSLCGKSI